MTEAVSAEEGRGQGLSFNFAADGRQLIASVSPSPGAMPIDEAWLHERLSALGHASLKYHPAAATALLAHYNAGSVFQTAIAERVDARLNIDIAPDGLEAYLDIAPAQGGQPATRETVMAWLAEHGIGSENLCHEAIEAALEAGTADHVVIARGRPAEDGRDGFLESLIPAIRSRVPRMDETGHIDYRDLGDILVVHPGDPLMRRHSPTAGTPGMTLLGTSIPARPGQAVAFSPQLTGTEFAVGDPDLLLAAITGQPVVVGGGAIVEPVFAQDSVNTATGNIDFEGSVKIKGDVSAGMIIRATGDIEVGGVVEVATLEAGGCIVVKGGVMGDYGRGAGAHHLRCGGSLNAGYAQQARIDAGDSIFIDDTAMQCELIALNHIQIGNKRRGHIIGGLLRATLSITGKVVGSPNRVRTHCEIGVNPQMHKQILELAKRRDGLETQLLEVSKLLDFAARNTGKLPAEMIDKARFTAATLSAEIADLRAEQDELTHKVQLSQHAHVIASQAIYEGVEVVMGTHHYRAVGEHGAGAVALGKYGLELKALE